MENLGEILASWLPDQKTTLVQWQSTEKYPTQQTELRLIAKHTEENTKKHYDKCNAAKWSRCLQEEFSNSQTTPTGKDLLCAQASKQTADLTTGILLAGDERDASRRWCFLKTSEMVPLHISFPLPSLTSLGQLKI